MMGISSKIGLRNLRRRPGRTALTVAMLGMGTFLVVLSTGMNEGTYADMIRMATGMWSGHFQLQHQGYKDTPALFETIDHPEQWLKTLSSSPKVAAVTARIESAGLMSAGPRTAGVQLIGVMPERELKVATLTQAIKTGSFLGAAKDPEAIPIVLGSGLAKRLSVTLHDEVVFMGQGADGSIAAEAFSVVGLLDSGVEALDMNIALIRLEDAQVLFVLEGKAHTIVGRLHELDDAQAFAQSIPVPPPLRLYSWRGLMPELYTSIQSDRAGGAIFMVVIVLVVILGVVNTLLMAVFERTRELGVMKALGASPRQLISMILWESAGTALLGVSAGVLLGVALVAYMGAHGVNFFEEPVEFGGMKISTIYPANTLLGTVIYPAFILLFALLGGLWPALRAAKQEPTEAIRGR